MKKAQMEIAGLLIVVVLVTITILFLLTFKVQNYQNNVPQEQESRDSYIRDRFSPVLMETSTLCDGRTIRVLLSDCGYAQAIDCPDLKTSCEFANETIKAILEETLDVYGLKYSLMITASNNNHITFYNYSGCSPSISRKTSAYIQPLVTDYGPLLVNLTQCD